MWDLHHCHNAVIRVGQMAPAMESMLKQLRKRGVTVIHAPSSCMSYYQEHPARKRAIATPVADNVPGDIGNWCSKIPSEDAGTYPIDQSDGGEDDDPVDHAKWAQELSDRGLNARAPWTRQTEALSIDPEKDFISDGGPEIWSILENRNIKNVILVGVHTNMCVLGRPFGLRQMAKNGKNVVLMRDLTDTMYNPAAKPFVSHFSGTDLIVEHIEKYVCPTITSDQIIGGTPFVFPADKRKHIAIVMAEDEYETNKSLPAFAAKHLQKDYRVTLVFGSATKRNDIPGLEIINDADLLLLSIRRRTLPPEQLKLFRDFEASGKPMIGIRTASHAFCLRNGKPADGLADWPEFDAQVWGGNYSGHTKNGTTYRVVRCAESTIPHPIFTDVDNGSKIIGNLSLYQTAPLAKSASCILRGVADGEKSQPPVAWTNQRANGGQSFYTSLGHVDDFAQEDFQKLLRNAVIMLAEENPKTLSR
jgi:nicotinamidase-related amidase/type 1 glutamine amidotransferase